MPRVNQVGQFCLVALFALSTSFFGIRPAAANNQLNADGSFLGPGLSWTAFISGDENFIPRGIGADGNGFIYVVGNAHTAWGSPVRAPSGGLDAFVAKFDSATGSLIWNTFLGSSGGDYGWEIAVDSSGNSYIAGEAGGDWGCEDTQCTVRAFIQGAAFVAKVDTSGNLVWNTFLGGGNYDSAMGIAVDAVGNVFVGGRGGEAWTCSPVPCTVRNYSAGENGFIAKLNASGVLVWNSFLGGPGEASVLGLTLDTNGNIFAVGGDDGEWGCPAGCTVRPYGGAYDGYVAKLDPSGTLLWNSFLGGPLNDQTRAICVDGSGNVYVAGTSYGTWGNPIHAYGGQWSAYAAKLDPSGALQWNTFMGDSSWASDKRSDAAAIDIDTAGNIYVVGTSWATWGDPLRAFSGWLNTFIAGMDTSGVLTWNAFLGEDESTGEGLALDGNNDVYVLGESAYIWGVAPPSGYNASSKLFVAGFSPTVPWNVTVSGNSGVAGAMLYYTDRTQKTATADGAGNYVITVPYRWSGTVIPAAAGYVMLPDHRDYSEVKADLAAENYDTTVPAPVAVRAISDSCALTAGGGVKCWGGRHLTPVDVSGLTSGVIAVSSGKSYACALTVQGGVKCWGRNVEGQLGDGTQVDRSTPVDVVGLNEGAIAVSTGSSHTCAVTASGGVKCWGANTYGELGDASTTPHDSPVDVVGLTSGVVAVAVGDRNTCALTTGGGVKCWGANYGGQLGDGTTIERHVPVDVLGFSGGMTAIDISCALTETGGVKCWGSGAPAFVNGLTSGVTSFSFGGGHRCVLMSTGGVKCWGSNNNGEVGDGTDGTPRSSPVDVYGLTSGVAAIHASSYYQSSCALKDNGSVVCWGGNYLGQVGDGTFLQRDTPADVVGLGGGPPVAIQGNVGIGDALITYWAGVLKSAPTDASGNYSITVPYGWSGAVTPARAGYAFSPAHLDYSNLVTGQSGQDYQATVVMYTIAGNAGVAGANIGYGEGSVISDNGGAYSFVVPYGWSGTTTPSKPGYVFTPDHRDCTGVAVNLADQDFAAYQPPVPASPIFLTPRTGIRTNSPVPAFNWRPVPNAASYEISLATDMLFTQNVNLYQVGQPSFKPGAALSDGLHYWRVRARNSASIPGSWSAVSTIIIKTTPPPAPTLLVPGESASVPLVHSFSWSAVADAARYQLQVDNDSDFSSPMLSITQPAVTRRKALGLAAGSYYWRVRAQDAVGNWGIWSTPFSFTIESSVSSGSSVSSASSAAIASAPVLEDADVRNWLLLYRPKSTPR